MWVSSISRAWYYSHSENYTTAVPNELTSDFLLYQCG